MPDSRPPFPADDLRAAAPGAQPDIDALHDELNSASPDRQRIEEHVGRLRGWDDLVATVERWYMDPRTQAFLEELKATGI
jgi:hypothetical protein